MKKLKVTRATHPATFRQCKNLGEIIVSVEREGENQGLYVTQVYLNGRAMDHDEENLLDHLSTNEIQELEFQMGSINELVKNSIASIMTSIQETQKIAVKFANEFRQAQALNDEKVKYILIQCRTIIENLEEIFQAHHNGKFMVRHLSLWHEAEKELTNILQCILQSRKISDFNFVSDMIEFDLVQALDQWEETLEKEIIDNQAFSENFSLIRQGQGGDNGVDA